MARVRIDCPTCGRHGFIEVEENIVKDSERGVTAVNVANHLVCEHSFIAYIDKNFNLRDAFVTDFKVELPEININRQYSSAQVDLSDKIDLYLLSLNLPALTLTFILRACFNDKKVLLINDLDVINKHLKNFFDHIFQDSFKYDISIQSLKSYKKNKKEFKDYIVIDRNTILNDKSKLINLKLIKIEKAIVQKFLGELDPKTSLIIIKSEVYKAYTLAKEITQMNENLKEIEMLTSRFMIDHFERSYKVRIEKEYLDFLTGIVTNYFKVKVQQAKGGFDLVNYF